jgi:ribosomal protein S24E
MKVNIISKEPNPLMKRTEVTFSVDHSQQGGTPTRADVSRQLASMLNRKIELVFVKNLKTKRGSMLGVGEANIYDTIEQAKLLEPKHILNRNKAPESTEEPEDKKEQKKEEE